MPRGRRGGPPRVSAAIAPFARIARAPTILVKERDYIEAGRALGYSDLRIMTIHILPNIVAEILVMASLWLATAIRIEASLSFIGLGVRPPTATSSSTSGRAKE